MTRSERRLIDELQRELGLSAVDAHRTAFTALAWSRGWGQARIGRYLGVTRARVGQRLDTLRHWTGARRVPELQALIEQGDALSDRQAGGPLIVAFDQQDWQDIEFARGVIERMRP